MSDAIKHECGVAIIRLLKPLSYYKKKYGSYFYGINKMYLLLEKQHNRGQDGSGIAGVKFDIEPGNKYIYRQRSCSNLAIQDIFTRIYNQLHQVLDHNPDKIDDIDWLKKNVPFLCELYLGHVRYGTFGKNSIENVHPFLRQNNWKSRNLITAGNFNMTNVTELFNSLVEIGQYPKEKSDTITIMENIGHFLDEEVEQLYYKFKEQGYSKKEASPLISEHLDIAHILKRASKKWDGGYAIAGLIGHGDAFLVRDPSGIRPTYYYHDDEIVVITSERPVIQTALNVEYNNIKELERGNAIIIKKSGEVSIKSINTPKENNACSFERIYFSRGSDTDIYKERKKLGNILVSQIIKELKNNLVKTVFSFIPNTAETSFYGMIEGLQSHLNEIKRKQILNLNNLEKSEIDKILSTNIKIEKVAIKDAKLRTFITADGRDDLVAHVYDVTYGSVKKDENLVIIDDSIVRGTTLKKSIIRMLDRLNPKQIIIVSSAPQIRYPDCYGIDMTRMKDFIAFRAALELLKETNQIHILEEVYQKCKQQQNIPDNQIINHVKEIYAPFTEQQISNKIAELVTEKDIKAKVKIIYQTIENLHHCCPNNKGDWYFTGNYPTDGGNRVVNNALINFIENNNKRAY